VLIVEALVMAFLISPVNFPVILEDSALPAKRREFSQTPWVEESIRHKKYEQNSLISKLSNESCSFVRYYWVKALGFLKAPSRVKEILALRNIYY